MDEARIDDVLRGVRILVVEDEYLIAEDLASACTAAGGIVQGPFSRPEMAYPLVREGACDVAILDIKLRDETSYVLADFLQGKGVPFVFATGYDTQTIPAWMRNVPVWQKPYGLAFLIRGLATMLDLRRSDAPGKTSVPE